MEGDPAIQGSHADVAHIIKRDIENVTLQVAPFCQRVANYSLQLENAIEETEKRGYRRRCDFRGIVLLRLY